MSIIGALPVNLANGTEADASQVMTDLNFIVNAVNANAQPAGSYSIAGTLDAPSGTRMPFHQASAPTGWVIDTTVNNHTCLYQATGGSIVSTGNGYSSFCFSGWSTSAHTLTAAEIPAHTHNFPLVVNGGGLSGPSQQNSANLSGANWTTDGGTGGGQGHTHPVLANWQYITMCIAQKS